MTIDALRNSLADRYRIERELGQGGMATVYLAVDLKHDRQVAIKVLHPDLAAALGAQRFLSEIRTTANLQHPHILPLHDSGEADGLLFYVMPFVEGESLRDRLNRERPLPIDDAVGIAREVADALDYAHRHGVIHRDIKPENILLHDRRALVADFGIALAVQSSGSERMTQTGLSLGTPHYMSPEQAMGEKHIDARSDVYALGAVLYEMLAGDPPFTGSTVQAVVAKVMSVDAEPVSTLRKNTPPHVAAAVHRALEKLPADRFPTAQAFSDALGNPAFASGAMPRAAGGGAFTQTSKLTYALGAACIALAALAGWALLRPRPEPPVSRYALALPPEQTPLWDGFVVGTSDGSRLVYLGPGGPGERTQLWVKARDRLDAVPLAGTGGATSAAISADDASLAFITGSELLTMPITGGPTTTLAHDAGNLGGDVAWLSDGSLVYAKRGTDAGAHALIRIPAGGGAPHQIWRADSLNVRMLTALPGARGVIFQACDAACPTAELLMLDLQRDSTFTLEPGARVGYVVQGGRLVYVTDRRVAMAAPFDLSTLRVTGPPTAVVDTVSLGQGTNPYLWVSANGGTLAMQGPGARSGQTAIYHFVWVDSTGRVTPVDTATHFEVTQRAADFGWRLSPDGRQVVVGVHSASGDQVWVMSLATGAMSKVTTRTAYRPNWRPDGTHISFVSDSAVYVARADGTGGDSLIWRGMVDEALLSPNGRWLLVRKGATGPNAGGRDILGARLGVDSTLQPVVATPADEMAIALSPNGRWLAYQSNETGRREIYVRPFPPSPAGGRISVSARGGTGPAWSRDGNTLYYLRADGEMMATPWPPGSDGRVTPRPLFRLDPTLTNSWINATYYTPWDVGADGRFLMIQPVSPVHDAETPLIVVEHWNRVLQQVSSGR